MLPSELSTTIEARKDMAGSLTKFIYQEDSPDGTTAGRVKLVNLDESNQRALGELPATPATATAAGLRKVEKMSGRERYIILQAVIGAGITVSRKIIVSNPINPFFLAGGNVTLPVLIGASNNSIENVVFTVTQSVGEVRKFALLTGDSGLNDGSNP